MPLNIEAVADDTILFLRQHLPAQIESVSSRGTNIPLKTPAASSYYIGEWSRYRSYNLPAIFLVTNTTKRGTGRYEGQSIECWKHGMLLDVLLEGTEEERLTRACWRMADAVYSTLHDRDVTTAEPAPTVLYSTKVHVVGVDYGPMITKEKERTFRKDIFLTLSVDHFDQLTPIG